MSTKMKFSTHIKRDPQAVFALLHDLHNYHTWLPHSDTFEGMRDISDNPVQEGTTYIDGEKFTMYGSVIKVNPDKNIAFRQKGKFKLAGFLPAGLDLTIHYTIEPDDEGTHLIRDYELNVSGVLHLLKPILIRSIKAENERIMNIIKSHLESTS